MLQSASWMVFLDGLSLKGGFLAIVINMRIVEATRSASAPLIFNFPRVTRSTKGSLAFSFLAHVPWMNVDAHRKGSDEAC